MEADHIAAVSTIIASSSSEKLRRVPLLGALWGVGHTAAILVAGLLVLLLAVSIPEKVTNILEFGAGMMLVFLGATALTGFSAGKFIRGLVNRGGKHIHVHLHPETGVVHSHEHDHRQNNGTHRHSHKLIVIGMIHGMAGSGALILAVLATVDSVALGVAYIAIFGVGSVASMAAMSALIGMSFDRLRRFKLDVILTYTAAIVAIAIGASLLYELGAVIQIFST